MSSHSVVYLTGEGPYFLDANSGPLARVVDKVHSMEDRFDGGVGLNTVLSKLSDKESGYLLRAVEAGYFRLEYPE